MNLVQKFRKPSTISGRKERRTVSAPSVSTGGFKGLKKVLGRRSRVSESAAQSETSRNSGSEDGCDTSPPPSAGASSDFTLPSPTPAQAKLHEEPQTETTDAYPPSRVPSLVHTHSQLLNHQQLSSSDDDGQLSTEGDDFEEEQEVDFRAGEGSLRKKFMEEPEELVIGKEQEDNSGYQVSFTEMQKEESTRNTTTGDEMHGEHDTSSACASSGDYTDTETSQTTETMEEDGTDTKVPFQHLGDDGVELLYKHYGVEVPSSPIPFVILAVFGGYALQLAQLTTSIVDSSLDLFAFCGRQLFSVYNSLFCLTQAYVVGFRFIYYLHSLGQKLGISPTLARPPPLLNIYRVLAPSWLGGLPPHSKVDEEHQYAFHWFNLYIWIPILWFFAMYWMVGLVRFGGWPALMCGLATWYFWGEKGIFGKTKVVTAVGFLAFDVWRGIGFLL
ncbi:hypothetical protein BT69DRAFT_1285871 [Atractiella rhizophila]|nr:hypothetical protein BT69DRAFT_1285871 [Atractiella rhizophila]